MADVFISYSKSRSVEAAELASELADLGYDVWWDISLLPTGSFGAEIDCQLDKAKAVIVIWSPESLRSKWVRSEASHGDRQDKLVNTHTADPGVVAGIPKPIDLIHSVSLDNIRAIVGALDRLGVPRSRGTKSAPLVAMPVNAADVDHRLFTEVEKAATAEAYQFYLDEFPQGAHAPVARFKLRGVGHEAEEKILRERVVELPARDPEVEQSAARAKLNRLYDRDAKVSRWLADGLQPIEVQYIQGESHYTSTMFGGVGDSFQDCWQIAGKLQCGPEVIVVPAGRFMMGDTGSQRQVMLDKPFSIGRFTLTFDEWDAAQAHPEWERHAGIAARKAKDHGWGRGRQPAIEVSWEDAKAYCKWLSAVTAMAYRLPSEAEWEYCCRAGTTTEFWWGNEISTAQANYNGSFDDEPIRRKRGQNRQYTVSVNSFEANPWGLYQVHGNIWEWCEDVDGSTYRVLRGGCWADDPGSLRSAEHHEERLDYRDDIVGFRVARTL